MLDRIRTRSPLNAVVFIATSLSERLLERLLASTSVHEWHAWRCRDARNAAGLGASLVDMCCRDRSSWPREASWSVFHASGDAIGSVGELVRSQAGRSLWVSPSESFAACFACSEVRAGSVIHGYDPLGPAPQVVISAMPERLVGLGAAEVFYLHRIRVNSCNLRAAGECHGFEWVLTGEGVIEAVEGPISVARLFDRFGVRRETVTPANDKWLGWLNRVSDERLLAAFAMSRADLASYESLRRQVSTWLPDECRVSPDLVGREEPAAVIRHLRRCVLPEAATRLQYAESPAHGLQHAWIVSHLAALLATMEDEPPLAPMAAAVFHDCARLGDDDDDDHPRRGAAATELVLPQMRSLVLPAESIQEVVGAIGRHSLHDRPRTRIEALLRDADRLPLAWERGAVPGFFSTASGLYFATRSARAAEEAFRQVFSMPLFDSIGFGASRQRASERSFG